MKLQRIKQYYSLANGNNTTYFSLYKGNMLNDIFKLLKYHPTRGCDYTDWSIVLACVASGKILVDPSKSNSFIKIINGLETKNIFITQVNKLYIDCGLGEAWNYKVSALLDALDGFIFNNEKKIQILI